MTRRRAIAYAALAALSPLFTAGCHSFKFNASDSESAAGGLAPLRPNPSTIAIRYTFVERPVGDPLLSREIWKDVSEILTGNDPELTRNLTRNGFRVGWISSFPDSLQQLLSRPGEEHEVAPAVDQATFAGSNLFVRHGDTFIIQAGDQFQQCELSLYRQKEDAKPESLSLQSAHGLFKVTAYKQQEGWASLNFIPEIQHGRESVRPVAAESGWDANYSQLAESLYGLKFKLEMNVGDTAIVTARENSPGTAGYYFFRGVGANSNIQRALLVRLVHVPSQADLKAAAPANSEAQTDFSSPLMKLTH